MCWMPPQLDLRQESLQAKQAAPASPLGTLERSLPSGKGVCQCFSQVSSPNVQKYSTSHQTRCEEAGLTAWDGLCAGQLEQQPEPKPTPLPQQKTSHLTWALQAQKSPLSLRDILDKEAAQSFLGSQLSPSPSNARQHQRVSSDWTPRQAGTSLNCRSPRAVLERKIPFEAAALSGTLCAQAKHQRVAGQGLSRCSLPGRQMTAVRQAA